MGQRIEVESIRLVDDAIVVSTNRSLTGTDGEGFNSFADTEGVDTFSSRLAAELFEADGGLERVWVSSNVVVVKRPDGWSDESSGSTSKVIEDFFLFYPAA